MKHNKLIVLNEVALERSTMDMKASDELDAEANDIATQALSAATSGLLEAGIEPRPRWSRRSLPPWV